MMLAVVDARTYGFYEDYAMAWQSGPGCKVSVNTQNGSRLARKGVSSHTLCVCV